MRLNDDKERKNQRNDEVIEFSVGAADRTNMYSKIFNTYTSSPRIVRLSVMKLRLDGLSSTMEIERNVNTHTHTHNDKKNKEQVPNETENKKKASLTFPLPKKVIEKKQNKK